MSKGTSRRVTQKEGWPASIAGRDAQECADSAMAHGCIRGAAAGRAVPWRAGLLLLPLLLPLE